MFPMYEVRQTAIFARWFGGLVDVRARDRIAARISRIEVGNLGDTKSVGGGVCELRIDTGPGYRVYFVVRGRTLVILLCGGDKSSQRRDIGMAKQLAEEV